MTRITTDSAEILDLRHTEWLAGFKSGALFTLLCCMIGMGVAGWLA